MKKKYFNCRLTLRKFPTTIRLRLVTLLELSTTSVASKTSDVFKKDLKVKRNWSNVTLELSAYMKEQENVNST